MAPENPTQPKSEGEDIGTLTPSQEQELRIFGQPGTFPYDLFRFGFLLQNALTELKDADRALYLRLMLVVRANEQSWFDVFNTYFAKEGKDVEHLDANQRIGDPHDLMFTSLLTNDGHALRAALIAHMKSMGSAKKTVLLLEKLQKLLPELPDGADF